MTAEQALAAARIIRDVAASREGWGYYPLAEALEEYADNKAESIILQGYSYPPILLTDVIAAEAHQSRTVKVAIRHAGGWAVSSEASPDIARDELTEFLQELGIRRAEMPREKGK